MCITESKSEEAPEDSNADSSAEEVSKTDTDKAEPTAAASTETKSDALASSEIGQGKHISFLFDFCFNLNSFNIF